MKVLSWIDSTIALGLLAASAAVLYSALFLYPTIGDQNNSWIFNWTGHSWFLAIALIWYFRFEKRFPIGRPDKKMASRWAPSWIIVIAIAFFSDIFGTARSLVGVSPLAIVMNLLFYSFLVGLSEEFVFRGQIQTGLNNSIKKTIRIGGANLQLGTVLGTLAFAAFHFGSVFNLLFSLVFGIIVGYYYQKTENLWGAVIVHNVVDLLGFTLPILL